MFRLLIDTSVWLDIAKDTRATPVLTVVEEMVRDKLVEIIVPRVVLDEFQRNRQRVASESAKSLSSHFRLVRDAVVRAGGDKRKTDATLAHLDNVDHMIPLLGGTAGPTLDRIQQILEQSVTVEASPETKSRAAERALHKQAPFHHDKNAMADAIIIETYGECVRSKHSAGIRFAFVTHNKRDFSSEDETYKKPHPDFSSFFSRVKSLYFISLPEALRRIEPSMVSDILLEATWDEQPRSLSEILKAEELLFNQVWYNRHWNMRIRLERGEIAVVELGSTNYGPNTIHKDILEGAIAAAKRVERKVGKKHLGPWDDFEWGMINGKLSALRWVLGDEWDMLDT